MDFDKFSDQHKVNGFTKKPDLQKKVKDSKYFDLAIPKSTEKSMDLDKGDLLHIIIRNQEGNTSDFKKKTSKRTGGLKIYLPRSLIEKLNVEEDSLLDVFVSKY